MGEEFYKSARRNYLQIRTVVSSFVYDKDKKRIPMLLRVKYVICKPVRHRPTYATVLFCHRHVYVVRNLIHDVRAICSFITQDVICSNFSPLNVTCSVSHFHDISRSSLTLQVAAPPLPSPPLVRPNVTVQPSRGVTCTG